MEISEKQKKLEYYKGVRLVEYSSSFYMGSGSLALVYATWQAEAPLTAKAIYNLFFLGVGVITYFSAQKGRAVSREISGLEAEIGRLESQNEIARRENQE